MFGPKGQGQSGLDLYVASLPTSSILQYDGDTGALVGEFVPSGSGSLSYPGGLVFGPDGNLYVTVLDLGKGNSVLRYQGPRSANPGAFIDAFVAPGSGGLTAPIGLLFGPDVTGDGHQDLYVTSGEQNPNFITKPHTSAIKVYDGQTGAFIRDFVAPGSSRLDAPSYFTFTDTDPVTLEYLGD